MAQLEGIRIQNYRGLKDVVLGKTFEEQSRPKLERMIAVIGPNGSGKSSLMDVFGFLGDCVSEGVDAACDAPHRGGFNRLRTRGQEGPLSFELYYREDANSRPISYTLKIDVNARGQAVVASERLRQRRKGQGSGQPFSFLDVTNGRGYAWAGEATESEEGTTKLEIELADRSTLGITTFGNLADHPRIVDFREFLEDWYLSYFVPDLARQLPMAGAQPHLDREGTNLANYVEFMERKNPERFKTVLKAIASRIPGIGNIDTTRSADGRLLLRFNESGFVDVFFATDMSDGTLKMLAYLLLLQDPDPAPFIGIEEPENGLHHKLLGSLADEMRAATRQRLGPQILVTTHSPYFVDALTPEEVWVLEKNAQGFATARRAADVDLVTALKDEGLPLGSLWYSNHFGGNP